MANQSFATTLASTAPYHQTDCVRFNYRTTILPKPFHRLLFPRVIWHRSLRLFATIIRWRIKQVNLEPIGP